MIIMPSTNYVYGHREGSVIVYIGSGTGGRAWACKGTDRRNEEHKLWIETQILDRAGFVDILYSRVSKEEASTIERKMIEELQPKFNYEFTEAWAKEKSEQGHTMAKSHNRRIMTPAGEFASIAKAATRYGKHPNTIAYRCTTDPANYYYLDESKHWRKYYGKIT